MSVARSAFMEADLSVRFRVPGWEAEWGHVSAWPGPGHCSRECLWKNTAFIIPSLQHTNRRSDPYCLQGQIICCKSWLSTRRKQALFPMARLLTLTSIVSQERDVSGPSLWGETLHVPMNPQESVFKMCPQNDLWQKPKEELQCITMHVPAWCILFYGV